MVGLARKIPRLFLFLAGGGDEICDSGNLTAARGGGRLLGWGFGWRRAVGDRSSVAGKIPARTPDRSSLEARRDGGGRP